MWKSHFPDISWPTWIFSHLIFHEKLYRGCSRPKSFRKSVIWEQNLYRKSTKKFSNFFPNSMNYKLNYSEFPDFSPDSLINIVFPHFSLNLSVLWTLFLKVICGSCISGKTYSEALVQGREVRKFWKLVSLRRWEMISKSGKICKLWTVKSAKNSQILWKISQNFRILD